MPPIRNIWLKPNGKIPGDSIFHHAFLSYVSDSGLLVPCMYPHGLSFMSPNLKMIASLDHAMWFQKETLNGMIGYCIQLIARIQVDLEVLDEVLSSHEMVK